MSTVPTGDLLAALALVKPAIPARPMVPQLGHVTLAPGRVTAFDYDWSLEVTTPRLDGLPCTALPHGLLVDAVKAAREDTVTLVPSRDHLPGDRYYALTSGTFTYKFDPEPDDMPPLPVAPEALTLHGLDATEWARITRVMVAAGRDDTLPTLTGIRLIEHDGNLYAAATDRYRLAVSRVATEAVPGFAALIPAAAVQAYTGLVKDRPVELWGPAGPQPRMWFRSAGVLGDDSHVELGFHTLDGEYPKVMSLLAQDSPQTATIDRAALNAAVRTLSKFIERNQPVQLHAARGGLTVQGGSATEALDYTGTLPDLSAFNPTFLREGLAALTGDRVTISWTAANRPYVLTGDDDTFRYLLMPVRLTS